MGAGAGGAEWEPEPGEPSGSRSRRSRLGAEAGGAEWEPELEEPSGSRSRRSRVGAGAGGAEWEPEPELSGSAFLPEQLQPSPG